MKTDTDNTDDVTGADSLHRIVGLSDPLPEIPDDLYDPKYAPRPYWKSAADSMSMGFWVWREELIGFMGRKTGVMLSPEWVEVLER